MARRQWPLTTSTFPGVSGATAAQLAQLQAMLASVSERQLGQLTTHSLRSHTPLTFFPQMSSEAETDTDDDTHSRQGTAVTMSQTALQRAMKDVSVSASTTSAQPTNRWWWWW